MKRRDLILGGAAALISTAAVAQAPTPQTTTVSPASPPMAAAPATSVPPTPAVVQAAPPAPPAPHPMGRIVKVKLATAKGDIIIELYPDKAPITVANWLRYVDQKRYDGAYFYRASHAPNDVNYGVIQGGLADNPEKMLPAIAHESTTKTGLKHVDGSISLSRNAPGSARSDFFIVLGTSTYLDADPKKPGDNLGFATFGKVIEGMDIVRKIIVLPTSPTKGVGVMKGQMLEPRVPIRTARRIP